MLTWELMTQATGSSKAIGSGKLLVTGVIKGIKRAQDAGK
jgi:hypothetical protein